MSSTQSTSTKADGPNRSDGLTFTSVSSVSFVPETKSYSIANAIASIASIPSAIAFSVANKVKAPGENIIEATGQTAPTSSNAILGVSDATASGNGLTTLPYVNAVPAFAETAPIVIPDVSENPTIGSAKSSPENVPAAGLVRVLAKTAVPSSVQTALYSTVPVRAAIRNATADPSSVGVLTDHSPSAELCSPLVPKNAPMADSVLSTVETEAPTLVPTQVQSCAHTMVTLPVTVAPGRHDQVSNISSAANNAQVNPAAVRFRVTTVAGLPTDARVGVPSAAPVVAAPSSNHRHGGVIHAAVPVPPRAPAARVVVPPAAALVIPAVNVVPVANVAPAPRMTIRTLSERQLADLFDKKERVRREIQLELSGNRRPSRRTNMLVEQLRLIDELIWFGQEEYTTYNVYLTAVLYATLLSLEVQI